MDFPITDILLLFAAGALGGFLSGLLGVGGGIIFIPILDFVFTRYGLPQDKIVTFILANSLFIIVFTGILNSYRQYRAKNFYPRYILYTAIPAIGTALFFTWLITTGTWYNKQTFSLLFIGILAPLVIRMLFTRKKLPAPGVEPTPTGFGLVGLGTGVFTAFSGLGGGMIMIPAFTDILKVDVKKATSISAGVVPVIALVLSASYLFTSPDFIVPVPHIGYIIYPVSLPMVAGTFTSVGYGVKLSHRSPSHVIKTIFAIFSLVVITKMIIENIILAKP